MFRERAAAQKQGFMVDKLQSLCREGASSALLHSCPHGSQHSHIGSCRGTSPCTPCAPRFTTMSETTSASLVRCFNFLHNRKSRHRGRLKCRCLPSDIIVKQRLRVWHPHEEPCQAFELPSCLQASAHQRPLGQQATIGNFSSSSSSYDLQLRRWLSEQAANFGFQTLSTTRHQISPNGGSCSSFRI